MLTLIKLTQSSVHWDMFLDILSAKISGLLFKLQLQYCVLTVENISVKMMQNSDSKWSHYSLTE